MGSETELIDSQNGLAVAGELGGGGGRGEGDGEGEEGQKVQLMVKKNTKQNSPIYVHICLYKYIHRWLLLCTEKTK